MVKQSWECALYRHQYGVKIAQQNELTAQETAYIIGIMKKKIKESEKIEPQTSYPKSSPISISQCKSFCVRHGLPSSPLLEWVRKAPCLACPMVETNAFTYNSL